LEQRTSTITWRAMELCEVPENSTKTRAPMRDFKVEAYRTPVPKVLKGN